MNDETKQSVGDTAINADPNAPGFEVKYGDWHVAVADLPPAAIAYLLQNGFSQSMTDAAALTKAQKFHPVPDGAPEGTEPEPLSDEELEEKVFALRQARFERILAGTVAVRTGGAAKPVSNLEKVMQQVATERLRAALGKKGLTLPQGKDKQGNPKTLVVSGKPMTREELIAAFLAKNSDDVRAEAQRRIDDAKGEDAEELDELLG